MVPSFPLFFLTKIEFSVTTVDIVVPALRTIGNIAAGNSDHFTQLLVEQGALKALKELLKHSNKTLRKESCWTISNITATTEGQIQSVIDEQIIPILIGR